MCTIPTNSNIALRGLVALSVRTSWSRMVTSTTTSTVSGFPTDHLLSGGFALRTPFTAAMRGMWIRVASCTAATVSGIPTDRYPNTNDTGYAYYVLSNGYVGIISGNVNNNSYGVFALRTSTTTAITLRLLWGRMVASSTASTMWPVPTADGYYPLSE